jgi:hypothetical protein
VLPASPIHFSECSCTELQIIHSTARTVSDCRFGPGMDSPRHSVCYLRAFTVVLLHRSCLHHTNSCTSDTSCSIKNIHLKEALANGGDCGTIIQHAMERWSGAATAAQQKRSAAVKALQYTTTRTRRASYVHVQTNERKGKIGLTRKTSNDVVVAATFISSGGGTPTSSSLVPSVVVRSLLLSTGGR